MNRCLTETDEKYGMMNVRKVKWQGLIARDDLTEYCDKRQLTKFDRQTKARCFNRTDSCR